MIPRRPFFKYGYARYVPISDEFSIFNVSLIGSATSRGGALAGFTNSLQPISGAYYTARHYS